MAMAKQAGKARAHKKSAKKAGKKKAGKGKAQKKAAVAKKRKIVKKAQRATKPRRAAAPVPAPGAALAPAAAPPAVAPKPKPPVLSNASRAAVANCVQKYMNWKHSGWDADLQGETRKLVADYRETPQSIPLIFNCVRNCLASSGFTFVTTTALVQTCVTGTVSDMEYGIYRITTLT
jgi:hypothetical protein